MDHHAAADRRYCCPSSVLEIMHRTFLLFPVREIPAALSHVCVPVRRSCVVVDAQTRAALSSTPSRDEASKILSTMMPPTAYEARFTWKGKSSRLVTLLKRDHATTVIWDHASDTCFAAAPCVSLGPGCPVGTALLGQVVLDVVVSAAPAGAPAASAESSSSPPPPLLASSISSGSGSGSFDTPPPPSSSSAPGTPSTPAHQQQQQTNQWIPNILVFDIIQLGDACNFSRARCPAMERYSVLLNLNHPSKGVFTSQHLKVQWAGKLHSLMDFDAAHRDTMPHIIDDYIRLGDEDPFEILFLQNSQDP